MKPFILASSSPRRKELLEQAFYSFTIQTSKIEEVVNPTLKPHEIVSQLAEQKVKDVLARYPEATVLGADTIVVYDEEILGKPTNERDAKETLRKLSGRTHQVFTGVSIQKTENKTTFYQKTDVSFYELSEEDIDMYIRTKEPFDKAGSYGIQGFGAYLVKEIIGDYFSVVGLPLSKTMRELKSFGIFPTLKS
ncbi:Maf family protein [Halalkalibacter urbisdiaboli]|uniref:Maf family protein n=1 Tax=Halalkalibacter urbisdiaboli TaxID=1960589 RepID=UPI000B433FDE|nr:Maf family protein [Halalkalibacter urbisdiaboli]